jgi:hypothetical protein
VKEMNANSKARSATYPTERRVGTGAVLDGEVGCGRSRKLRPGDRKGIDIDIGFKVNSWEC